MNLAVRRLSLVLVFAGAFGAAAGAAAGETVTLKSLVSEAEYKAMGLDKLSVDEQARLVAWLQKRVADQPVPMSTPTISFGVRATAPTAPPASPAAPTAPVVAGAAIAGAAAVAAPPAPPMRTAVGTVESFGLQQDDVDGDITAIRARVVGEFKGWDGQTVFKLDNGQHWRQSMSGTYRFKATDPEVTIEKSLLGYKLRLAETHRSVPVRRIK